MLIPENVPTADNTTLNWHDRCPRLYQLSAQRGLRKSGGNSAALQFGSIIHAGLEAWYRTRDPRKALEAVRDYEDFVEIPEEFRTRGRALVTIAEYIEWWGENTQWWGDEVLFTETPFILEDGDGFRYGGKIDLVVMYHGNPWIVDHKTTSRAGDAWWAEYKISPQMAGYSWAGSLLHGQPIKGAIINRIKVHANKKPPHEQFERQAFEYDAARVAEWRESKIQQYNEISAHIEADYFPPRFRNCVERYGKCSFFDVCTTKSAKNREKLISKGFKVDPWDWMQGA